MTSSGPAGPRRLRRVAGPLAFLVVVTLALGTLASCGLRTPSGVRVDQRSVDTAADDPDIRKLPPGPVPGAGAGAVVEGFLEAAAADPDESYARAYLASGAVWSERAPAQIYQPDSLRIVALPKGPIARVELTARIVGTLTTGGAFRPDDRTLRVFYELRRTGNQWRISYAPPGVLLAPRDLSRTYRLIQTYSFNPDRSLLVGQPGYVVSDRAGLASAGLHALLTNWSGTVSSADRPGDAVLPTDPAEAAPTINLTAGLSALGSVVVRDGEATVDLGREAFNVPQPLRPLVVAQIAASLSSVPGVFTVRVLVEERPYAGGAVPAQVPQAYASSSSGPALAVSAAGGLVSFTAATTGAVPWSTVDRTAPTAPTGLRLPAVAPGGDTFAVLLPGAQTQLIVAGVGGADGTPASGSGGRARTDTEMATEHLRITLPLSQTGYLQPQWLDGERLLLTTVGAAPRSYLVDVRTKGVRPVAAAGLAALGPLWGLEVSRDGTQVVAVAGPDGSRRAYLGRIARATSADAAAGGASTGSRAATQLVNWTPLPTNLADVAAVTWTDDLTVTALGRPARNATGFRAETLPLDQVTDPIALTSLPSELTRAGAPLPAILTAPGRATVLSSGVQRWMLRTGEWSPIAPAGDSAYG